MTPSTLTAPASSPFTQSADQERAAFAWVRVNGGIVEPGYKNLAKGAPALVMSNGLMQTLAFCRSKRTRDHLRLLEDIALWLGRALAEEGFPPDGDFMLLMARLHGSDSATYIRATEETLEILRWIRQFASAVAGGQG